MSSNTNSLWDDLSKKVLSVKEPKKIREKLKRELLVFGCDSLFPPTKQVPFYSKTTLSQH